MKKDGKLAIKYFEQAIKNAKAEESSILTSAQFSIGKMYLDADGVPRDENLALQNLEKASLGGHIDATRAIEILKRGMK